MSQSATLVGFLAVAFLLYVAAKGRLPVYTAVLWGPAPQQGSDGGGSGGGSGGGGGGFDWATAAKVFETVAAAG